MAIGCRPAAAGCGTASTGASQPPRMPDGPNGCRTASTGDSLRRAAGRVTCGMEGLWHGKRTASSPAHVRGDTQAGSPACQGALKSAYHLSAPRCMLIPAHGPPCRHRGQCHRNRRMGGSGLGGSPRNVSWAQKNADRIPGRRSSSDDALSLLLGYRRGLLAGLRAHVAGATSREPGLRGCHLLVTTVA